MNDRRHAGPAAGPGLSSLRAAAALALAGAALLAACGPRRQAAPPAARAVTAAAVVRATIEIDLEYAARIRPSREIIVSPKIPGRVTQAPASVGRKVQEGEVLFTLETKDIDAQYRQARAALESARANLTRTADSSLHSQVLAAEAAVKQAQVQVDDLKDLYERARRLYESGAVPRQQLDGVKAKYESAGIALDTARQNLALIREKGGPQSSEVAAAQVDQAQAAADLARSQMENTVVRSPIAGIVAARNVDPGELVSSSVPAFVVIDIRTVTAEASVSESMVEKVHPGDAVAVTVEAAGASRLAGVVDSVSPAPDPRTMGYLVKVTIDNSAETLRPGMFARVFFPVERREEVLVVPNGAVVTEAGVDYVYAVVGGVVRKKVVETGLADAAVTELRGGLEEGDLVVTGGQSFLNDGDPVVVSPE